ncbi:MULTISPECIES: hypothetical protein [unclassified Mesotoga]|uniref:hypothetical protein n=1 Tax=unclassified Mesotoga TaxID=1184398 RepID=UPI0021ACE2E5|nr:MULTISPECIES: hypothetical protein [unclassified Mesotoga]
MKYGREVDLYHIIRALTFFNDVENSPDPLEAALTWKEVKECLEAKSKELFESAKIWLDPIMIKNVSKNRLSVYILQFVLSTAEDIFILRQE